MINANQQEFSLNKSWKGYCKKALTEVTVTSDNSPLQEEVNAL